MLPTVQVSAKDLSGVLDVGNTEWRCAVTEETHLAQSCKIYIHIVFSCCML